MKRLKSIDHKILFELMKNAKRSDREIAKKLGVSQATVSRRRAVLERELIDGYTAVPKWEKLGYEILAITLIKYKPILGSKEKFEAVRKRGMEWLMKRPNIILGSGCQGSRINSFTISVHKSYPDYDKFMHGLRFDLGDFIDDIQPLLVNLSGTQVLKPLHLKYLAETGKASED